MKTLGARFRLFAWIIDLSRLCCILRGEHPLANERSFTRGFDHDSREATGRKTHLDLFACDPSKVEMRRTTRTQCTWSFVVEGMAERIRLKGGLIVRGLKNEATKRGGRSRTPNP